MKTNKDYILYILIRDDLPSLNPGKAMAQSIHAGHLFTRDFTGTKSYKEWAGDRGFGTTVTLSANKETIDRVRKGALYSGWVVDPTYPLIAPADVMVFIDPSKLSCGHAFTRDGRSVILCRKEHTCAYLFGERSVVGPLVSDIPMYQ